MLVFKTASTQNLTEDSLRVELAKAQYIALKTDSALNVYYDIQEELEKGLEASRIELNRYIKEQAEDRKDKRDLTKELIKANNNLAKAKKANLTWFLIGGATGIVLETVGLVVGLALTR